MSILFRYVAREMLAATLLSMLVLVSLFTFFDFLAEMAAGSGWTRFLPQFGTDSNDYRPNP